MAFGEFMKKLTNPSLQIKPPSQEKMSELLNYAQQHADRIAENLSQRTLPSQSSSSNGLPENLQNLRNDLKSRQKPVPDTRKWFK